MYTHKHIGIDFKTVESVGQLEPHHQKLVLKAREAAWKAYAPYSKFYVGAAVELDNGEIVLGSNKENASFPAGICAERNALNYVSDHFPDQKIVRIAVTANPQEFTLSEPVSPCGVCRQVMAEYERVQKQPFEILLTAQEGEVLILNSAVDLLPFHFYLSQLKK
jgi:cytidine deaminase